jgi:hypothetical protein
VTIVKLGKAFIVTFFILLVGVLLERHVTGINASQDREHEVFYSTLAACSKIFTSRVDLETPMFMGKPVAASK